jgi:hypothetical protein
MQFVPSDASAFPGSKEGQAFERTRFSEEAKRHDFERGILIGWEYFGKQLICKS